jgi:hypothetical protein
MALLSFFVGCSNLSAEPNECVWETDAPAADVEGEA